VTRLLNGKKTRQTSLLSRLYTDFLSDSILKPEVCYELLGAENYEQNSLITQAGLKPRLIWPNQSDHQAISELEFSFCIRSRYHIKHNRATKLKTTEYTMMLCKVYPSIASAHKPSSISGLYQRHVSGLHHPCLSLASTWTVLTTPLTLSYAALSKRKGFLRIVKPFIQTLVLT